MTPFSVTIALAEQHRTQLLADAERRRLVRGLRRPRTPHRPSLLSLAVFRNLRPARPGTPVREPGISAA
jgi:hypothetical protein